jgi:hypothetical protein
VTASPHGEEERSSVSNHEAAESNGTVRASSFETRLRRSSG